MKFTESFIEELNEDVGASLAVLAVGAILGTIIHRMLTTKKNCDEKYAIGTSSYAFCLTEQYKKMATELEKAKESCKTSDDEKNCRKKFEKAVDLLYAHVVRQEVLGKKLLRDEQIEAKRQKQIAKEKRQEEREKRMKELEKERVKNMSQVKSVTLKHNAKLEKDLKQALK